MAEPILRIDHLSVDYEIGTGRYHALSDVSFEMPPGHVVGIVGETGCGKSTLAHSIPRLLREPPARVVGGHVWFGGTDLLALPKWKLPYVRGTGVSMIFQEPINSLNPAYRIYDQLEEAVRVRRARKAGATKRVDPGLEPFDYSRPETPRPGEVLAKPVRSSLARGRVPGLRRMEAEDVFKEVLEALRLVRINDPETIFRLFPHELSGGMRQRIMIAMALSGRPTLLIADEPTSALDITIQAQVLTLMKELMDEVRTSILFISHDLGVIAEMADDIGVMYAGHLVEFGPVREVFEDPRHPYTKALLRSIPRQYKDDGPLPSLPGSVPNVVQLPSGCTFHPRCVLARDLCSEDPGPPFEPARGARSPGHLTACFFSEEVPSLP